MAKFACSQWNTDILFVRNFAFHSAATDDLDALSQNAVVGMATGNPVGIEHYVNVGLGTDRPILTCIAAIISFERKRDCRPRHLLNQSRMRPISGFLCAGPMAIILARNSLIQVFSPSLCSSSLALTLQNTSLIESFTALRPFRCGLRVLAMFGPASPEMVPKRDNK